MPMTPAQVKERLAVLTGIQVTWGEMQNLLNQIQQGDLRTQEAATRRLAQMQPSVKAALLAIDAPPEPLPTATRIEGLTAQLTVIGRIWGDPKGLREVLSLLDGHHAGGLAITLTPEQVTALETSVNSLIADIKREAAKL